MGKQGRIMAGDGKVRKENDNYPTPIPEVKKLLKYLESDERLSKLSKNFLEPACGEGNILLSFEEKGYKGIGVDIVDYGQEFITDFVRDPLFSDPMSDFMLEFNGFIVTNPPYSLLSEFILNSKKYEKVEVIIMLLKQVALSGIARANTIWRDKEFPLSKVLVIPNRLKFEGYKHSSPQEYNWYVWDRKHKGNPTIEWLDGGKRK